jgi:hypothetical protein
MLFFSYELPGFIYTFLGRSGVLDVVFSRRDLASFPSFVAKKSALKRLISFFGTGISRNDDDQFLRLKSAYLHQITKVRR